MNKVEENVLIPKEEYEILIEKANHTKNDNVNSIGSIGSDKKGVEPDVATASTSPHSSPESEVKQGDGSPSSNVPSPSKDVVREVEGEATKSTASADDGEGVSPAGVNDLNHKIDTLAQKVTSEHQESVRLLAGYIIENGGGIIEWDDELRFIHLKEVIPRTNIVKIIMYLLDKKDKPPRGATMFKRSLKSIGIKDVKSWVFSQTGNMMSPYAQEKKVTGTEKRSNDSTDGGEELKKPKKKVRKDSAYAKLASKWISW